MLKTCRKCGFDKDITLFSKNRETKDGFRNQCKECINLYYKERKEHFSELARQRYKKNRDYRLQKRKEYLNTEYGRSRRAEYLRNNKEVLNSKTRQRHHRNRETNIKKQREYYYKNRSIRIDVMKKWRRDNLHLMNAFRAERRARLLNATPKWLTKKHKAEISEFYKLAKELAWLNNGQTLHVDHIIPLKGREVCGLHVPWNLQLLPANINISKGNKYET